MKKLSLINIFIFVLIQFSFNQKIQSAQASITHTSSIINSTDKTFSSFQPQAIYGEDNRLEVYESNTLEFSKATSIAGMMEDVNLVKNGSGYKVIGSNLNKRYCENSKYSQQILGPHCTGFLVAPHIIVTAGHCIVDKTDCENNHWIFDYQLKGPGDLTYTNIPQESVYKCKQVLSKNYQKFGAVDYAMIELDRPVLDRPILQIDFQHQVQLGDSLFVIGFPKGLPMKIANSAVILENYDLFFRSNLDVFQGNSGSPVFDAQTGNIIGITSNGHADYTRDKNNQQCKVPKVCTGASDCHLSAASKIQNLKTDLERFHRNSH